MSLCIRCLRIPDQKPKTPNHNLIFEDFVKISSEHMAKYWVGGQACCFDKMTSHLPVVVQQKTIVLQNLGGRLHPLASQVSATGKNTRGLGPESQGFSKFIFEISRFWFSRGWKVCTSSASRYDKQDKLISSLKSLTLRVILQKPKKFLEIITTLLIFLRHFFQLSCPEVRIFGV